MKHYKLIQPEKKPLSERLPFYFFATGMVALLYFIVAINPTLNGNWATWGVSSSPAEWIALNTAVFFAVGVFMIPTIYRSNQYDFVLAIAWANRDYLDGDEFSKVLDELKPTMIRDNGAKKALRKLQGFVDAHKGKHIAGHKYFKKEYIKDLELA